MYTRSVASICLISLTAYALVLLFFTPQYVLWRGLYITRAFDCPEVRRASFAVQQLGDPFTRIDDPSNSVLQWRRLFPLVGHYLHFPVPLFLAMPQLGCFITLAYIARLASQVTQKRTQIFCATALMATTSWFFISNSWLSYNDSWCMLGLLIVSFSTSRPVLIATCLLEPFVDERFVLAIPLTLAARFVFSLEHEDQTPRRDIQTDVMIVAGLTIAYALLRIIALRYDSGSTEYITRRQSELHQAIPAARYLLGFWMSLRLVWLLVVAIIWLTFRRRKRFAGLLLSAAVGLSIATGLVIAGDLSRSLCAPLPLALLGLLGLMRRFPGPMSVGLPALLLGNLVLPASNVVTVFTEPISSVFTTVNQFVHPPDVVNPDCYLQSGKAALELGKPELAVRYLDWSLRLDPNSSAALFSRAQAKSRLKDFAGASADERAAMKLSTSPR